MTLGDLTPRLSCPEQGTSYLVPSLLNSISVNFFLLGSCSRVFFLDFEFLLSKAMRDEAKRISFDVSISSSSGIQLLLLLLLISFLE